MMKTHLQLFLATVGTAVLVAFLGDIVVALDQVIVSDDGTRLLRLVDGKQETILTIAGLPKSSTKASGFALDNLRFANPAVSPDRQSVVFTVIGGTHCWIGVVDRHGRKPQELDFMYNGAGGPAVWSKNSRDVAVVTVPGSGLRSTKIYDTQTTKIVVTLSKIFGEGDSSAVETFDPVWTDTSTITVRVLKVGSSDAVQMPYTVPAFSAR